MKLYVMTYNDPGYNQHIYIYLFYHHPYLFLAKNTTLYSPCYDFNYFLSYSPYTQLEALISKNYYLYQSARDGFRSYLTAYASYSLKSIFNLNNLDLQKVGKSFGFSVPPRVDINMGVSTKEQKSGRRTYKKNEDSDKKDYYLKQKGKSGSRQWSR